MADKRKYVIPGDVITSGPFRPEQNVVLEGNDIIATSVGISEIYEDSVKVIPLTGKYIPKINDLVIGKVISHTSLSCLLYTSPSPRDLSTSRMPSSA